MLSIEGLTVVYPGAEAPALDCVDLDVADAEVVALLGASGCGKTTLLRAVAGLQPVVAGCVRLGGRNLASVPTHHVPDNTTKNRSLGWKCGRLMFPAFHLMSMAYGSGLFGSPYSVALCIVPAALPRHSSASGSV